MGRCVELGYLELSVVACEAPDVTQLLAAAELALELAIEFNDTDLEGAPWLTAATRSWYRAA